MSKSYLKGLALKAIIYSVVFIIPFVTTTSYADEDLHNPSQTNSYSGMYFDIGAPSGLALGVLARHPKFPYVKLGAAATMLVNGGLRANLIIDPIKFPVAPIVNIDIGYQFPFAISDNQLSFTYSDLQGGISIGNRDGFRFVVLAGAAYVSGYVSHFQKPFSIPWIKVDEPSFSGFVPSAKIGFVLTL